MIEFAENGSRLEDIQRKLNKTVNTDFLRDFEQKIAKKASVQSLVALEVSLEGLIRSYN